MNSEVNHTSGSLETEVLDQGLQQNRPKLFKMDINKI